MCVCVLCVSPSSDSPRPRRVQEGKAHGGAAESGNVSGEQIAVEAAGAPDHGEGGEETKSSSDWGAEDHCEREERGRLREEGEGGKASSFVF